MSRKVAIIGGATSRNQAPYGDDAWEIWAFSSLRLHTPRITRWFEMHALGDLKTQLTRQTARRWSYENYMKFLKGLECPVYMQRVHKSIPRSVAYPLEEALQQFGKCFTSTASYLLALALMEEVPTIGVWGIHLTEKNVYQRQRPGVEYLLGVAKERGVEVILPRRSPLRIPSRPVLPATPILYGYDWESPLAWWRPKAKSRLRRRRRRRR